MNNLLVDYAISLTHLYGLVHKDKVAEIYNMQNEEQVDVEEVSAMLKHPPEEFKRNFVENFDDYFVAESIMDNAEFEEQLRQRRGKPFYIPEQEELLKYKDELYFEESKEYQAMMDYMADHFFDGDEFKAQMLCEDLQGLCQFGFKVQKVLDVFNNRGVGFESKEQLNEVMQLVMNLANSTRIWENNGHTPSEIFEKYEKPLLRPLPKEPFDFKGSSASGLADDQKSSRSNVVSFPSGRKIGRNDPCPCGSGKKYKNCCL